MTDSDFEFEIKEFDDEIADLDKQLAKGNSKKGNKELLIVESPKKTAKIASFLGKNFIVKSSKGHIRNLVKKGLGLDVNNNFKPTYVITDRDHERVVIDLKKALKECHTVWLATDYDREGEGIAWHVAEVLKLQQSKVKVHRIIFTEITKKAITNAIKNPQKLDQNMVYSQQARQALDKLIGYRVSSTLHHRFKNYHLSAGRVQSVAVKLIMERENEIKQFESSNYFKVDSIFQLNKHKKESTGGTIKAVLDKTFDELDEARQFIEDCKDSKYKVDNIKTSNTKRKPSPPFTTSSLQQEASSKIGYSPKRTMQIAQKLYEGGHITYMRTDSVALSEEALNGAKEKITKLFGDKYSNETRYKNKKKSSQEAHEACRPCKMNVSDVTNITDPEQGRLYKLIWARTMACQMSPAQVQIKNIKIRMDNRDEVFVAKGEEIKFDGFLAVWNMVKSSKGKTKKVKSDEDSEDDDGIADEDNEMQVFYDLKKDQSLYYININATEKLTKPPHGRFTEASLVKKMEDLEIGRPSTYASIVSTIQARDYVERRSQEGTTVEGTSIQLIYPKKVNEETVYNKLDSERNKLFLTDLGKLTCEYLSDNFIDIMDYKFTAEVENMLDDIAQGKKIWYEVVKSVYDKFNPIVEKIVGQSGGSYERLLGTDPNTGHNINVIIARFGPCICLTHPEDKKKNKYIGLDKNMIESVTLEEALQLLHYPCKLGKYEETEVIIKKGPRGFYLNHGQQNYGFETNEGEFNLYETVTLKKAIKYIKTQEKEKVSNVFAEYDNGKVRVLRGKFGPYICYQASPDNKVNVTIPKKYEPSEISLDECMELITNKMNKYKNKIKAVDKQKKKERRLKESKTDKTAAKKEIKSKAKTSGKTSGKPVKKGKKKVTKCELD